MQIRRFVLAAALVGAPVVTLGLASPAEATCQPGKPSTCPIACPDGFERVVLATGGQVCVPDLDHAGPPLQ